MRILVRLVNKVLAVTLLLVSWYLAYRVAAEPVAHHLLSLRERIGEQRQLLGRLQSAAVRQEPQTAATRMARLQAGRTLFLNGVSDPVRLAELQSHLSRLSEVEGVELRSSRALATLDREGVRLLGLEAQLSGELASLQRLLHRIETERPSLIVDAIQILAPMPIGAGEGSPPRLEARVSVLGATLAKDGG